MFEDAVWLGKRIKIQSNKTSLGG